MFKRIFPTSLAGLLVLTACTGTPTATPDTTKAPGDAAARFEGGGWGYGSGGLSQQADSGSVATASADSSTTGRGGGAIGSGN